MLAERLVCAGERVVELSCCAVAFGVSLVLLWAVPLPQPLIGPLVLGKTYFFTIDNRCIISGICLQIGIQPKECKRNNQKAEYHPPDNPHYAFSYCK